ncbi:3-deoxy-D-manno-octulosonic acid transferase [Ascidiaceihabitans donghaensis]|uniref:3-deoxy-D-manno-octulosonic acid transferase n=1 Tax=Ascidiaceihabitans donghaensis TaxID=1510460 RepID=A0A2R8BIN3_9RHOB|nr:glycosyltransferase N-terminal domain-containing protein [Ascidiaceihabitans donghaensis]SPH22990.1 3-deoxy-D-manno-octulosonic acid transferase [Ascidiaceihabitans donghaensis]
MVTGLGLSAYRALSRRRASTPYTTSAVRPSGALVWMHAPEEGSADTAATLARRLAATLPDLTVIVTVAGKTRPLCAGKDLICETLPQDHPDTARQFIDHWKPDVALWLWGNLQQSFIDAAAHSGAALFLVNAGQNGFDELGSRWRRDVARRMFGLFDKVIARSDAAATRLAMLGCSDEVLEQTAPLQTSSIALPFAQTDFDEMADVLKGRPVWHAAAVQPEEVAVVLEAHRHASRMSHRLLLVLNPADPAQENDCIAILKDQNMRFANWDEGAFPDDNCQVLLAPSQGELGLWYRCAPVSFLGSSLVAGKGGLDPMQAAALGSAVLYGPNVRNHLNVYTRLATVGAARIVNDANALGVAVTRLMAPDHAATMALAGWDVASESAAVTDRIVDLVQDALDARQRKG